jgi:Protein of unknown function (DUF2568)
MASDRPQASRFGNALCDNPALRVSPESDLAQQPVKAANLALKSGLELAALAAFAYWGTTLGGSAVSVPTAVAVPLAMIVLWGTLAAPNAQHRLSRAIRIAFELTVFALAAGALLAAGAQVPAAGFAALVLLNSVLLTRFTNGIANAAGRDERQPETGRARPFNLPTSTRVDGRLRYRDPTEAGAQRDGRTAPEIRHIRKRRGGAIAAGRGGPPPRATRVPEAPRAKMPDATAKEVC